MSKHRITKALLVCFTLAGVLPGTGRAQDGEEPVHSLQEVLLSTLRNHEGLEIASEGVAQARFRKKRFFLSITPDVSFQAYGRRVGGGGSSESAELEEDAAGGPSGGPVFLPEGTFYGYNLSLTQPVYTGGRATSAYRGAGALESAERLNEELVRRDLLVAAGEAYYGVLAAIEAVRIGEQGVRRAERHLELAQKRLDLGEGVVTDRLRAEVNLAQVESDLIGFRNRLANARDGVQRVSGRPLAAAPAAVEPLEEITGSIEELVEEALASRLELEQERQKIRAAEQDVREKKGRFSPALFIAANYTGSGEAVDDQTTSWDAGLYLRFPIYERASRFYLLKESRASLRQSELASLGRTRDVRLEVSGLYNSLQASEAQIRSLRKQVELAAENLRLAEKRFAVGLADSIELIDTQTTSLSSQVELTAERLRHEIAKLRLLKALGREIFPRYLEAAGEGHREGIYAERRNDHE